ncbi:MAG: DUF1572 family protein [Acidobacteria bacterium]|nr:DUF1572 family protein [Acidobacteriota bacterium]
MLKDFLDEYERYKVLGERALQQIPDAELNRILYADGNSAAMLVRHISGNFRSRFTDFLMTDGEKPWRDREAEFAAVEYARQQMDELWAQGWEVLLRELSALRPADLSLSVTIRGQAFTVHEALCRSLAHVAMHVGQLILLARLLHQGEWQWISIPKGQSAAYDLNPTMEKRMS